MKAILTLGLTKQYRRKVACDRVHLSVNEGEIFGLLGPNGAGKSTLVKMLVGLVNPSAGSARVLGFPLGHLGARRRIGYLPELFRYPPWLRANEVLDYHASLLGFRLAPEARDRLLARVGLSGRGRERVRSFSKGMQQRLGLAVALVGDPDLIFLDEPTSALDPLGRYEVSQLLLELRAEGRTVFLNSHLLSDVEKICDSVALIDAGVVKFHGPLAQALAADGPRSYRLTVGRLAPADAEALRASWPSLVVQWDRDAEARLQGMLSRDEVPTLVAALVERGARVYAVETDETSLERWFLHRLGKDRA
ncbi:MAG: ABC transporter ATP-binding protein [Firmicutes bacterium]|nr:ABC transporter ATP-binding protein [Bacillota bacterium]